MSHTSRLGTLFASPGQAQDVDEHARPTRSSRRATSVQRAHALLCFDSLIIVLEGNGRAAWGAAGLSCLLQRAQVPALPCAGRARMDGQ